nr:hypothetical protein [uncultured Ottowia sp.]
MNCASSIATQKADSLKTATLLRWPFCFEAFHLARAGSLRDSGGMADSLCDKRCGSCRHFCVQQLPLARLGLGQCALLMAGHLMNRQARCTFFPSRWSALK